MDSSGILFDIILIVVITMATFGLRWWRKLSLGRLVSGNPEPLSDSPSASAILSYYTAGHGLINVQRGKVGDMSYSLYATMPQDPDSAVQSVPFVDETVALYALDLPFNTESHFIGLSKDQKMNRVQFANFLKSNGMEKINLEGDFSNYFDIYAPPNQGFEVRTVLEPDAMNFVVEYCHTHFWEINSSQMYFVATSDDVHDAKSAPVLDQSQKFINEIKPALLPGMPGAAEVHHETPYGVDLTPALPCPICTKMMTVNDRYQICPQMEGIFINARNLQRLHTGTLQIPTFATKDVDHGPLACPNCHNLLVPNHYQGGPVEIDSCVNCPFRWLDATEVPRIAPRTA